MRTAPNPLVAGPGPDGEDQVELKNSVR